MGFKLELDKYTKRNSSIELLRMFFMFGIVIGHVYAHGSSLDYSWIYGLGNNWDTAYHLSLFSLGKVGVTGFIFISGYYGLSLDYKKLLNLVLILVFYLALIGIIAGNRIPSIFSSTLHPWDYWWFIKSYLLILVLSPIINEGIARLSQKQFSFIIFLLLLYTYFGHFIDRSNAHDTDFLLGVFLIARYVKLYPPPLYKKNGFDLYFYCFHFIFYSNYLSKAKP